MDVSFQTSIAHKIGHHSFYKLVPNLSILRITVMTPRAFELLDDCHVRIADKTFRCHYATSQLDGKPAYSIEGTSDERNGLAQRIFIHDFRDICPTDLPNGISVIIDRPKSTFKQLNFANLTKADDRTEIELVITFYFSDWHLPINLQNFAAKYCEAMLGSIENIIEADFFVEDVSVMVTCRVSIKPTTTFLVAYRNAADQILTTYRNCLESLYIPTPTSGSKSPKASDDSTGTKWWFRYVIVPILGSGAVAAIAAALIALLK